MNVDYFDYSLIPENMMKSLKSYIENGDKVGGFLTAILTNDLFGAVARADMTNKPIIPNYVNFLVWESPYNCHGNDECVKNWQIKKGLKNTGE